MAKNILKNTILTDFINILEKGNSHQVTQVVFPQTFYSA